MTVAEAWAIVATVNAAVAVTALMCALEAWREWLAHASPILPPRRDADAGEVRSTAVASSPHAAPRSTVV